MKKLTKNSNPHNLKILNLMFSKILKTLLMNIFKIFKMDPLNKDKLKNMPFGIFLPRKKKLKD